MLFYERGSAHEVLGPDDLRAGLFEALDALGPRERVLAVPPDITRVHSFAGPLTRFAGEFYGARLRDVLPATGTHTPMTAQEIGAMYAGVPPELFRVHDWRGGTTTLGEVPAAFIREVSEGRLDYAWPAQVDRLLTEDAFDLILSIGQVVPHEVVGMANYNKNILVGTGGADGINKSHFLGAVYGMERMMGHTDTPVRRVLNYATEHFARDLPIVYVQTVVGRDGAGRLCVRGLFIGDDAACFERAAALAREVNVICLAAPLEKAVVYLDPGEYRSTWLGNKSIYRLRMAMADGGELIVLAPGVRMFGEDPEIDRLIRAYGYGGTAAVLDAVERNADLRANLSAAAHLIHGSSEGRFTITYCPGGMTREAVEGVGFRYGDPDALSRRYAPEALRDGWNTLPDGERVFYVSNPGLGLWAWRDRFEGAAAPERTA
ncbi:MAG: DUF2088 domain-containing protein [Lentisphaerae bacterium]|nr:DUF2088 domain-containing protein [Lentisphaerota bacterium]